MANTKTLSLKAKPGHNLNPIAGVIRADMAKLAGKVKMVTGAAPLFGAGDKNTVEIFLIYDPNDTTECERVEKLIEMAGEIGGVTVLLDNVPPDKHA